ncbi:MAG: ImmA/IrrE family metallo-endopeptidase [Deltaproteobacteria bacterium]|nr:ImmA/IrrE family metallo-endopeptidase [Deltaproteobacteria bacterium]
MGENKFGRWLREARESAGVPLTDLSEILQTDYKDGKLSLRDLANISQINFSMLDKVEQGKRFLSDEKIEILARIFDADSVELISLKNQDKEAHASRKMGKASKFIPGFRPAIEAEVLKFLKVYRQKKKIQKIEFPLEVSDFFKVVFGLETRKESFSEKQFWKKGEALKLAALFIQSKTILINEDLVGGRSLPEVNQRFSVAHEGAHFICSLQIGELPEQPIFFRSRQLRRSKEETLVDYWAGALLMPKPQLTDKIEEFSKQKINPDFVANLSKIGKDLCKYFGVSRQALEIRLRQIGIQCKNTFYGR